MVSYEMTHFNTPFDKKYLVENKKKADASILKTYVY